MKAVSIKEAIGSAVKASADGNAIIAISEFSSSFLKTLLNIKPQISYYKILPHSW